MVFWARNHLNEVVASGSSPPIMITDDHKSARARSAKAAAAPSRSLSSTRSMSDLADDDASPTMDEDIAPAISLPLPEAVLPIPLPAVAQLSPPGFQSSCSTNGALMTKRRQDRTLVQR